MARKAFANEDKDLGIKSLLSSRSVDYKDIDLSFNVKTSGDVYKKTHAAAVKQAVKNLIMTNFFEKPFQPFFGGNITALIFELSNNTTSDEIKENITNAIEYYEPRAKILDIIVNANPDSNTVSVSIQFKVVSTEEIVILETSISRLR
jgi:phage baseplate assembly protein W|tara:strand:- start:2755 stop:3198 length:444 start_codon:yes stop_codon:yes gene_type:complete